MLQMLPNLGALVLGCIEGDLCEKIRVLQYSSKSIKKEKRFKNVNIFKRKRQHLRTFAECQNVPKCLLGILRDFSRFFRISENVVNIIKISEILRDVMLYLKFLKLQDFEEMLNSGCPTKNWRESY